MSDNKEATNVTPISGDNPGPRGHERMVPIEEVAAPVITDLNDFANLFMNWHHNVQATLNHMAQIPDGAGIEYVNDKTPDQVDTIILTGDALKAYRLGVLTAMAQIEKLPFQAVVEDEPAPANDAATES